MEFCIKPPMTTTCPFLARTILSDSRTELTASGTLSVAVEETAIFLVFSTTLLTSAFVQYNEASQEMVTNLRFRWIHAPLSDLYLVLTERRDTAAGMVLDRFLTAKVTKLFSF